MQQSLSLTVGRDAPAPKTVPHRKLDAPCNWIFRKFLRSPYHPHGKSRGGTDRCNARKSAGPKTDKGKARTKLHALKHSLRAATVSPVLPHKDLRALDGRIREWTQDMQPAPARFSLPAVAEYPERRQSQAAAVRCAARVRECEASGDHARGVDHARSRKPLGPGDRSRVNQPRLALAPGRG